jgi:predicted glycoside hydrolase/deacetylase ChbG (UPF0249 family)
MDGKGAGERYLVVTADDFGRTSGTVAAVVEAFRGGILTSASLEANGPAFDLAVQASRNHPDLSVGVHLVLDEYPPVLSASQIPSLVNRQGRFYPLREMMWRIVSGRASHEELRREWTAQVQKVADSGISIAHLDGHRHCHLCPNLGRLLVDIGQGFGIRVARLSQEPLLHFGDFNPFRYLGKVLLWCASAYSRRAWKGGLMSTRDCYGFMEGGNLSKPAVERIARSLRPGYSELFSHPSTSDGGTPEYVAYNNRRDLAALLAYSKAEFEQKFGLRLIPSSRIARCL